jgi:hypothetical protein
MVICSIIFVTVVRGAKIMRRSELVETGISHLAIFIEIYRDNHNRYPSSFEQLLEGSSSKVKINQILHDGFVDKYEYQPLTNGFVITVSGPSSMLYKWPRIGKTYKVGEAIDKAIIK